jgi:hypothetical protein
LSEEAEDYGRSGRNEQQTCYMAFREIQNSKAGHYGGVDPFAKRKKEQGAEEESVM